MWRSYRDFPFVDISAYDEAIAEYVDLVKHVPGVVEVVCIGGVSSPGISDIDIITVVDDDAKINPSDLSNASLRLRPNGSVWAHEVSVLPKSMWGDLHSIAYCSRMDLQLGNLDVQQPLPDRDELFITMFDHLMDSLMLIANMLGNSICNTRSVLLVLHGLKHTLRLCEEANVGFDQAHVDLVNEIQDIRTNWFKKKRPEVLYNLSRRFLEAFYRLACTACSSLPDVVARVKEGDLAPTIRIGMNTNVSFTWPHSVDVVLATKTIPLLVRTVNVQKTTFYLPTNIYWKYFLPYLEAMYKTGSISFIDWKEGPRESPPVHFEGGLDRVFLRRQTAVYKHVSFLLQRGFTFGTVQPSSFLPVKWRRLGFMTRIRRSLRRKLADRLL